MTSLPGFDELNHWADDRARGVEVAVVGGDDPTVLAALEAAVRRGWIRPRVVGAEAAVRSLANELCVSVDGIDFVPCAPEDAAATAVAEVRSGRARAVMKGQIATPALLKAILDPEAGLRTERVICQVVLMEVPRDGRRFLLADTGITIRPSFTQKAEILHATVEVAHALGLARPRVALLAASETVRDSMPETLHAQELSRSYGQSATARCEVQGPLSFDLAYASDAGARKRIGGSVVGAADAMIFPDLLSANLTVKAIMYTADCHFGGVLRGTSAPVVFMSRADDTPTRLNSLALALSILDSYPQSQGSPARDVSGPPDADRPG
jgi:phosphotransacetylase